jgi:DNA-directed RNA polymerase subunit RPC12/RpoP
MAEIKIICPNCGRTFECSKRYRGREINCPGCNHLVPLPQRRGRKWLIGLAVLVALVVLAVAWLVWPMGARWPDRRPIGTLFMASSHFSSPTNPRGWFNDKNLDFTGPGGKERFRKALLVYADNSITNMLRLKAQGVIVWDVEGGEFPHKISYIGDPRAVDKLAPEMAPVASEFFKRFRDAGLRVGVTIRPQELVFERGHPRQTTVLDTHRLLLQKIDYARTNWGVTIFYLDSNYGFWQPDEAWQLRLLAQERPDILLIPEHYYLPYSAFSAPLVSLDKSQSNTKTSLARKLFPNSFQALYIADASPDKVRDAWRKGDIILFRAWYWNDDCRMLENLERQHP